MSDGRTEQSTVSRHPDDDAKLGGGVNMNREAGPVRQRSPKRLRILPARYIALDNERRERAIDALAELLARDLREQGRGDSGST